jgi:hypothetical protein
MSTKIRCVIAIVGVLGLQPAVARAEPDVVLEWNEIAVRAMQVAPAVAGFLQPRTLAIVHVSMFDAINGIERDYVPIHVEQKGPRRASRRAAGVQAAYRALVTMFPAQAAALDMELNESLAAIAANESAERIQLGREWGDEVAMAILAWRANDNPAPPAPYLGSNTVGKWRPTPRPNPIPGGPELPGLPGAAPLLGDTQPFVIPTGSTFRPHGPPTLLSWEYALNVFEVKLVGSLNSPFRSDDQTESARFWAGAAASAWNRAAVSASERRGLSLSENARLFALLNIAAFDAIITCWESKYYFGLWRPIHAIRLADTDLNPLTVADPTWTPLIVTPPYPEYDSGHQSISRASAEVLNAFFGRRMGFETFSEGLPGVVREWRSFDAAADEASMARIWAGIHFRFAMEDAKRSTQKVTRYVLEHAAQRTRGERDDRD